jgi:large subunit ribosomal protein L25
MLELTIEKRVAGENLGEMRSAGKIPAVFYGPKEASTPIWLVASEFGRVWKKAGESSIITLTGLGEPRDVLIQDIDFDPVTNVVRHADFYAVEKGKKVQVNIEVDFQGVSGAVKNLGGILVKVLHEIEIEAMPKDLPHELIVDISALETFDSQITAGDIKLPVGVTLLTNPEEVIALVAEPKEEVEDSSPTDIGSIELSTKKGKKEEEAEPTE